MTDDHSSIISVFGTNDRCDIFFCLVAYGYYIMIMI